MSHCEAEHLLPSTVYCARYHMASHPTPYRVLADMRTVNFTLQTLTFLVINVWYRTWKNFNSL